MGNIRKISSGDIEKSLAGVTRQYLTGNLKKPQELDFILDKNVEIGITAYDEYKTEPVHYHTEAVEYQYMLSGWTKYIDVQTGKEYEFKRGDFYCIETNTIYAQKSKKGTRILFIKTPSVNDKKIVETVGTVKEWYEEGLKTIRKDYSHEKVMPTANSMRPAAAVAIIHEDKILMLKRVDNEKWTLPGGTMELDESLAECAIREVREESGLDVRVIDVIGIYTDPDIRIEYSDGEVRREFTIVYLGAVMKDNVLLDNESSAYNWIAIEEALLLPMAESQKKRLQDVVDFYKTGQKRIR